MSNQISVGGTGSCEVDRRAVAGGAFAKRAGWVGAGDGLLARDPNDDGTIDGSGELFGSRTQSGHCSLATCASAANDHWRGRLAA